MKKRSLVVGTFVLCTMLILVLSACGGGASSEGQSDSESNAISNDGAEEEFVRMDMTYATFLLENAPSAGLYELLQEKINERMDGAITITPYTNGSLLGQTDIFDGVINGVADMGFVQCASLADRLNLTLLLEYPGLDYNSSTVASYVMRDYLNELKPEELDDVVWMMPVNTAPNSIVSTKPIATLADLKGKQIRAVGVAASAVTALGGTPVSMSIGELYEALRNGLLDGAWIVPAAVGNSNLQEVAKYQLIVPIGGACQLVVMNKDKFNSMPKAQQELFMELANEVFEEFAATYIEDYELESHALSRKGFQEMDELIYLEGDTLSEFRATTEFLAEDYAAQLDALGYDGSGALRLARELCDKYNEMYPTDIEVYMRYR